MRGWVRKIIQGGVRRVGGRMKGRCEEMERVNERQVNERDF